MTGFEDWNYTAFQAAKKELTLAGHNVTSPADLPVRPDWDWTDYLLVDIDSVFAVDGVALLPGFATSRGARIECRIAQHRGIPIRTVDEWCEVRA
jgi:hypothetical protein